MKIFTLLISVLTLSSCKPDMGIGYKPDPWQSYQDKSLGSNEAFDRVYNLLNDSTPLEERLVIQKALIEILDLSKEYDDSAKRYGYKIR